MNEKKTKIIVKGIIGLLITAIGILLAIGFSGFPPIWIESGGHTMDISFTISTVSIVGIFLSILGMVLVIEAIILIIINKKE